MVPGTLAFCSFGTFAFCSSGLYKTTSLPQEEFHIATTQFGKSAFSLRSRRPLKLWPVACRACRLHWGATCQ